MLFHFLDIRPRFDHRARGREKFIISVAFAAFAGVLQNAASQEAAATPGISHAFVDVNVLPMDRERVLAGQTVLELRRRLIKALHDAGVPVLLNANPLDDIGDFADSAVVLDLYDLQHRFLHLRRLLHERQHVFLPVLRLGEPRERPGERRIRPAAGEPGGVVDHPQRAQGFDQV